MNGDLSRSTFRAENHYSTVRLQQGRILRDAECNEQAEIWNHLERATSTDVSGATGAPKRESTAAHGPPAHRHARRSSRRAAVTLPTPSLYPGATTRSVHGAKVGGEMGTWRLLHVPQRFDKLRRALDEHLRFGLEAATAFALR